MQPESLPPSSTDVIILGGGLVGGSLASALAIQGFSVCVVDEKPAQASAEQDGRTSAIAYGSYKLLEQWGIWSHLKEPTEPIKHIRVSQGGATGVLCYDSEEVGGEPLGLMVKNTALRQAVAKRMEDFPNIHLCVPDQVNQFEVTQHKVMVSLASGKQLEAPLLIAADGRHSTVRKKLGIQSMEHPYTQSAVIFNLHCSAPHHQTAYEHFLTSGPLAVLPLPDQQVAIVWTESPERAEVLLNLPEKLLLQAFQARFGYGLGKLSLASPCSAYPLSLILPQERIRQRIALVGDAAHVIHPVAGQGLNLGFRDVAVLEDLLTEHKTLGLDVGSETLLETYTRQRRWDVLSMAGVTHGLVHLFSWKGKAMRLLRQGGMAGVSKIPQLKEKLIAQARGIKA
ncbi:MAG: UbiH/UbiF/VisC/COQ6 family ubiquinone biosynthesis hydroxylase [Alphaproteobacteria bacterium]